jgi:hypothetical protein
MLTPLVATLYHRVPALPFFSRRFPPIKKTTASEADVAMHHAFVTSGTASAQQTVAASSMCGPALHSTPSHETRAVDTCGKSHFMKLWSKPGFYNYRNHFSYP